MPKRHDLIALRAARGLSIEAVAKDAGLSERTVRRIEKGESVALSTVQTLADFYGVPLEQITGSAPSAARGLRPWQEFWQGVLDLLDEPPTQEFEEYVRLSYERMRKVKASER